jgi:Raf kinase inhibitor-like YbhB/YbcL family protein
MSLAHTVKCLTLGMPTLVFGGQPGARAGADGLAARGLGARTYPGFELGSPAFLSGERLPARFSAEGGNRSPPLAWTGVPPGTRSLVLVVEDPDAPTPRPFLHWMKYGISPLTDAIPEGGAADGNEGLNSQLQRGYLGAAPPRGDRAHVYHFQLFALDTERRLAGGVGRRAVLAAMKGHVLAVAECTATYSRPPAPKPPTTA